jgi:hypothetical protein
MVTPELKAEYERLLIEAGLDDVLLSSQDVRRRDPAKALGLTGPAADALVTRGDFQGTLDSVSAELESFAPQVMAAYQQAADQNREPGLFSDDVQVMVAEFPTGEFGGSVRLVGESGALALINSGLLALMAQIAKLIVLTTAIVDGGSGFQYLDDVRLPPFGVTAADAMADVLARYLDRNRSRAGAVALPLDAAEIDRMNQLYRGMVSFTVAHEYAHAFAHHQSYRDNGSGKPEELPAALEGEADWLAVKLMLGRWRWGGLSKEERAREADALLPAPFLWYGLERLVSEAEEVAGKGVELDEVLASHSPTVIREAELRDYYDRAGLSHSLADLYEDWIWHHAKNMLAALAEEPGEAQQG